MHKIFTNTKFIGKNVIYLPTCHSTNDIATEFTSKKDIQEGTIFITDHQTAGKGQRGNSWEAEANKNLTLSIILKPRFLDITEQYFLNIIISLGIHDFLTQYLNQGFYIKWPNDVYYYDNKIGGILIENNIRNGQIESSIAGIGLNINQINFKNSKAVSLATICGQPFDLKELLPLLLKNIENRYLQFQKGEREAILNDYLNRLYWFNESHLFKSNDFFEGTIKGIDHLGRLMIQSGNRILYFNNKEVAFVK